MICDQKTEFELGAFQVCGTSLNAKHIPNGKENLTMTRLNI